MHKSAFRWCVLANLIQAGKFPAVNSAQVEGCVKTAASTVHFKRFQKKKKQLCSNISALIDGVAMGTREKLRIRTAA